MNKIIITTIIALLWISIPNQPLASEGKGLEIAMESDRRDNGWLDHTAKIRMILKNKHGEEAIRKLHLSAKEVISNGQKTDGDKILIVFDNPRDVKGTVFLTYSHKREDDDQWLYLPALKRIKRISAQNKSGSFVGSEFTYEDIASEEIEKYRYDWLRDEVYDKQNCFVVERTPIDKENTGYQRTVIWYEKENYLIVKAEFYDRKNMHIKTLTFKDYNQYLDKFWRAHELNMVNHQNGKSTRLEWSDITFQVGLTEQDFDKNRLKEVR